MKAKSEEFQSMFDEKGHTVTRRTKVHEASRTIICGREAYPCIVPKYWRKSYSQAFWTIVQKTQDGPFFVEALLRAKSTFPIAITDWRRADVYSQTMPKITTLKEARDFCLASHDSLAYHLNSD